MFFPIERFPFAVALERAWEVVRDECLALPGDEFISWHERGLYNRDWDVYGLFLRGQPIMENCVFCPRTAELVRTVPGLTTAGYSRLAPGTRIRPHVGYTDRVLRLHLALTVPDGPCGIRVGTETRRWQPGRCMVFDDTVNHEAWNDGNGERLVLLVDFLREGEGRG